MAKIKSTHTWGRDTARERYSDGGALGPQTTRSEHEGIDYSNPEKDMNYNLKGSKGELLHAMTPKPKFMTESASRSGPTRSNASYLQQTGKYPPYKHGGKAR